MVKIAKYLIYCHAQLECYVMIEGLGVANLLFAFAFAFAFALLCICFAFALLCFARRLLCFALLCKQRKPHRTTRSPFPVKRDRWARCSVS